MGVRGKPDSPTSTGTARLRAIGAYGNRLEPRRESQPISWEAPLSFAC